MRPLLALAAPVALTACVLVPAPYAVAPLPEHTPVALGQSVRVGDVAVTPVGVVEDSRCPVDTQCVWAGRLVVKTRIDGAGWRDTADLRLGETYGTHGKVVALVAGDPGRIAGRELQPGDYRFTYAAR